MHNFPNVQNITRLFTTAPSHYPFSHVLVSIDVLARHFTLRKGDFGAKGFPGPRTPLPSVRASQSPIAGTHEMEPEPTVGKFVDQRKSLLSSEEYYVLLTIWISYVTRAPALP